MPLHKIKRQEEVTAKNWKELLELSEQLNYTKAPKIPHLQYWMTAVIAIDWLTGKRINEILILKRKDITFTTKEIRLRFHVGKKHSKGSPIELQPYQKSRTLEHKAVPWIKKYLAEYDLQNSDQEAYLFPSNNTERKRTVNTKFINGQGIKETREYQYKDEGGHVYEENARYWLSKINSQLPPNKQIYFHYGRHSIGIKLAYQGKSDIQIAKILDETPKAALEYTKHAGGLSEEWTQETE
jgi:integrase